MSLAFMNNITIVALIRIEMNVFHLDHYGIKDLSKVFRLHRPGYFGGQELCCKLTDRLDTLNRAL